MSWYQYLDTIRLAQQEFDYWATVPPMACPRCGEPLKQAPQSAEKTLYCPFDAFAYPRDWVRPQRL